MASGGVSLTSLAPSQSAVLLVCTIPYRQWLSPTDWRAAPQTLFVLKLLIANMSDFDRAAADPPSAASSCPPSPLRSSFRGGLGGNGGVAPGLSIDEKLDRILEALAGSTLPRHPSPSHSCLSSGTLAAAGSGSSPLTRWNWTSGCARGSVRFNCNGGHGGSARILTHALRRQGRVSPSADSDCWVGPSQGCSYSSKAESDRESAMVQTPPLAPLPSPSPVRGVLRTSMGCLSRLSGPVLCAGGVSGSGASCSLGVAWADGADEATTDLMAPPSIGSLSESRKPSAATRYDVRGDASVNQGFFMAPTMSIESSKGPLDENMWQTASPAQPFCHPVDRPANPDAYPSPTSDSAACRQESARLKRGSAIKNSTIVANAGGSGAEHNKDKNLLPSNSTNVKAGCVGLVIGCRENSSSFNGQLEARSLLEVHVAEEIGLPRSLDMCESNTPERLRGVAAGSRSHDSHPSSAAAQITASAGPATADCNRAGGGKVSPKREIRRTLSPPPTVNNDGDADWPTVNNDGDGGDQRLNASSSSSCSDTCNHSKGSENGFRMEAPSLSTKVQCVRKVRAAEGCQKYGATQLGMDPASALRYNESKDADGDICGYRDSVELVALAKEVPVAACELLDKGSLKKLETLGSLLVEIPKPLSPSITAWALYSVKPHCGCTGCTLSPKKVFLDNSQMQFPQDNGWTPGCSDSEANLQCEKKQGCCDKVWKRDCQCSESLHKKAGVSYGFENSSSWAEGRNGCCGSGRFGGRVSRESRCEEGTNSDNGDAFGLSKTEAALLPCLEGLESFAPQAESQSQL